MSLRLPFHRPFLLIIVRSQLAERNLSTSYDARPSCDANDLPQLGRLCLTLLHPLHLSVLSINRVFLCQREISYERRTHTSRIFSLFLDLLFSRDCQLCFRRTRRAFINLTEQRIRHLIIYMNYNTEIHTRTYIF